VSEHLQVTGIDLGGVWGRDVRIGEFREEGLVYPEAPPEIASSYEEFVALFANRGTGAEMAIAQSCPPLRRERFL
jgi:hypothetical protein